MICIDKLPVDIHNLVIECVAHGGLCSEFLALACTSRYWRERVEKSKGAWWILYDGIAKQLQYMPFNMLQTYIRNVSLCHINKIVFEKWCIEQNIDSSFLPKSKTFQLICENGRITKGCFVNCFAKCILKGQEMSGRP